MVVDGQFRMGAVRFGLVFVDFEDGRKRYLKKSAKWFRKLLKGEYNGTRQKVAVI